MTVSRPDHAIGGGGVAGWGPWPAETRLAAAASTAAAAPAAARPSRLLVTSRGRRAPRTFPAEWPAAAAGPGERDRRMSRPTTSPLRRPASPAFSTAVL